nr:twin-arginine translocase subunit TatC [uncultured Prevotella sp.]
MLNSSNSRYLGLLISSPYILYELFHFVSPALFENERKYSAKVICAVYFLFIIGILISYYMLFPISFRFLGTYSVSNRIESTITLDSYVSTFITMTLLMGVVFQLPVISFVLGKMGIINATILSKYRKHAFIIILTIAAIITPGQDILSLILVTLPLYLLYEISIRVVKKVC